MNWIDILKKRKQTFVWKDIVPDTDLIKNIIKELHEFCPSKQKRVPYKIELLDWSDIKRRNNIFALTYCSENTAFDRRNPQVLAPYLITFSKRDTGSAEHNLNYELEMGMAAMFLTLSAANYGLDTGYCGCYHGEDFDLAIGIGYAAEERSKYYNPILKKYINAPGVPIPSEEKKPLLSEYTNV
jgi:hypothetical protein